MTNAKLPNLQELLPYWLVLNLNHITSLFHVTLLKRPSSQWLLFLWQVMLKNLEQVVSMILNGFQHPHPRVRWAAINAIGQLSTDLGPDLQVHYHQKVLPALANAMDDFQNPRVQVSSIISAKLYLTPFNLLLLICCINQLDVDEEVFVRPSY